MFENVRDQLTALDFAVYLLGCTALVYLCLSGLVTGTCLFREFVWSRLFPVDFVKKYGQWAAITGATDGIGKEYARQLAKRGLHILLISRTESKLKAVAEEIKKESTNVDVAYIVADFTGGRKTLEAIRSELEKYDVGILVNNVGLLKGFQYFGDMDEKDIWDSLAVNVDTLVGMTRIMLPKMAARGRGAVVNLSSSAAAYPTPFETLYSATKALVDTFSQALSHEYAGSGVTVQSVCPFYIDTAMTGELSSVLKFYGVFYPKADTFVESALTTLPHARVTTGYFPHWVQRVVFTANGAWVWAKVSLMMNRALAKLSKTEPKHKQR